MQLEKLAKKLAFIATASAQNGRHSICPEAKEHVNKRQTTRPTYTVLRRLPYCLKMEDLASKFTVLEAEGQERIRKIGQEAYSPVLLKTTFRVL